MNQILQSSVAKLGPQTLSARTSFMVETVGSLANRGLKTGAADSAISAEHVVRMKGVLGSLNKPSEPLGLSLRDLRETNKRGKWWLVGASFRNDEGRIKEQKPLEKESLEDGNNDGMEIGFNEDADLTRLARQLGMNTDVRRSIFVTIMSADDYETAYKRLQKLPLNSSQKTEIPRVLIRCSSAQGSYNPYFTLLARRLLSAAPRQGKAFQFTLWGLYDQMREVENGLDGGEDDGQSGLELRSVLNLARMFGTLIAEDGLSLRVLKNLSLTYLPGSLHHFVELLLITIILHSQNESKSSRDEKSLIKVFLKPKEMPDMAQGLQYFLRKVVSKTDIVNNKADLDTVKWGCRVARDALKAIAAPIVAVQ